MHHLVYLHGFLSSPESLKAQQTLAFAKKHYPAVNVHIPLLSGNINGALKTIDALMATLPIARTCFIGSSMGGFLSTYCIENYACGMGNAKAVLVNPAVNPANLLSHYLGRHQNPYTNEVFDILPEHIKIFKMLYIDKLCDPQKYKVLLQTGDETLDYQLAVNKYMGAHVLVEQGGDHSFVGYEDYLPSIFQFLV